MDLDFGLALAFAFEDAARDTVFRAPREDVELSLRAAELTQ
jgi:hypothetical protein